MTEQEQANKVELMERQLLVLNGVESVESFDEGKVLLKTALGLLSIKGERLNVTTLNLEAGRLDIEGLIVGLEYLEDKGAKMKAKGKTVLSKFIR